MKNIEYNYSSKWYSQNATICVRKRGTYGDYAHICIFISITNKLYNKLIALVAFREERWVARKARGRETVLLNSLLFCPF